MSNNKFKFKQLLFFLTTIIVIIALLSFIIDKLLTS
ncbi:uncharacterized protein METZ01_LOCUS513187 [marine metagenome]|uniref:Uncharacterized protein n=1 Tax=marine metagenome TaxID=408172 RepID=A0A383EV97_9ZZZZ